MKILKVLAVIISMSLLTIGCGSSGGGGEDTTTPPSISNLSYAPQSATLNQGGGAVTVSGSYDFIDLDGDITTAIISGNSGTEEVAINNISGMTSGTIFGDVIVETTVAGNFSFTIQVKDATGKLSNSLTGSFTVN